MPHTEEKTAKGPTPTELLDRQLLTQAAILDRLDRLEALHQTPRPQTVGLSDDSLRRIRSAIGWQVLGALVAFGVMFGLFLILAAAVLVTNAP